MTQQASENKATLGPVGWLFLVLGGLALLASGNRPRMLRVLGIASLIIEGFLPREAGDAPAKPGSSRRGSR